MEFSTERLQQKVLLVVKDHTKHIFSRLLFSFPKEARSHFVATWFVMQYKSTNNNFMLSFVLLCKLGMSPQFTNTNSLGLITIIVPMPFISTLCKK